MAEASDETRKKGLAVLGDEIKTLQGNAARSRGGLVAGERQPIDAFIDAEEAGGLREQEAAKAKKKKTRQSRLYDNPRSNQDDD